MDGVTAVAEHLIVTYRQPVASLFVACAAVACQPAMADGQQA